MIKEYLSVWCTNVLIRLGAAKQTGWLHLFILMLLYDIDIAPSKIALSNDSKIEVNRGNRIVDNPNQKLKTGIY